MRLRRDSDDGSWRKRYKLLFGRVEDGGVPKGALPPPVLFQNGLPAGRGGSCQETQLFRDGSWEGGSPFGGAAITF